MSLMEILGEFLGNNAKKMVHEDLANKIVIAKRYQRFEIRSYQSHLICWFVYK